MKQRIDLNQYNELSFEGRKRLFEWGKERNYYIWDIELPTIGQMIEFLDVSNWLVEVNPHLRIMQEDGRTFVVGGKMICWWNEELCDALWESCKSVLDREGVSDNEV